MTRPSPRQLLVSLTLAVGAFTLVAAGPLGAVKDAANQGRDQMEEASDKTAKAAEDTGVTVKEGVAADPNRRAAADAHGEAHDAMHDHKMMVERATAVLMSASGSEVKGSVTFRQLPEGVAVMATVTGLKPNSKHGFHVHEFGDPSAEDGSAMGGHYNPEGHDHGMPSASSDKKHAGDFGNLEADADGNATYSMTFDNISIAGPKNPILGRGLIIHEKPDDGGQPTGNAGGRIAQAVIGVSK